MKQIYSLRKNFSIIGITGRMGNGCSKVAELLASDKVKFFKDDMLRKPEDIILTDNKNKTCYDSILFQKKYQICYNYMQINWKKYVFIDYKKVLFLYCLNYFINDIRSKNFENDFSKFVISIFSKAHTGDEDIFDDTDKVIKIVEIIKILNNKSVKIKEFIKEIKSLRGRTNLLDLKDLKKLKVLYDIFFLSNSNFNNLFKKLLDLFTSKNYYLRTLFFHKIACSIRSTGKPDTHQEYPNMDNVYNVAKLINRLIKACKNEDENKNNCHIVINSLKNSLEIMYFKERYSAFYMMAIHNEKDRIEIFNDIVKNPDYKDKTVERLENLDIVEYRTEDFKIGKFSSPDIENCIQKSELHIVYTSSKVDLKKLPHEFSTLHEQLMKYLSLIQQPGIITPSNIERCMQIAFNSKFNSGCISRQVGAVITNEGYSVKSIGWNDTPKKTIPCLLRNVEEVINGSSLNCEDHTYSDFELPTHIYKYKLNEKHFNRKGKPTNVQYHGKNFSTNIKDTYPHKKLETIKNEGKNCSYCFKTLHNKFVGEENQVHTRSLHAEENAMLQISKFGGQGLKNGFLFATASPCELCSKKAYQLGITRIFYIDNYPGIAKEHIIKVGFDAPQLNQFKGAVGRSFNKFFEPFLAYKDELNIYLK